MQDDAQMNANESAKAELLSDFASVLQVPAGRPNLDAIVNTRLVGVGLKCTCSRCAGTGRHSYCQQYGDTCFKCGGKGHVAQKLTRKLLVLAKDAVAAGKLDAYFERNRRRVRAQKALDRNLFEPLALRPRYANNAPDFTDSWSRLAVESTVAWDKARKVLAEACDALRSGKGAIEAVEKAEADIQTVVTFYRTMAASHPDFCASRLYRPGDEIWRSSFSRRFLIEWRCGSRSEVEIIGALDLADACACKAHNRVLTWATEVV